MRLRTFDAQGLRPGRFRPEQVDRQLPRRLGATIGERVIEKQAQRSEAARARLR